MATVRLSTNVRSKILDMARGHTQKAVDTAFASRSALPAKWSVFVYDTIFADELPKLRGVPPHWLRNRQTFTLAGVGCMDNRLEMKLPADRPFPVQVPDNEYVQQVAQYSDTMRMKPHPVWNEFFAEANEYQEQLDAAKKRQDDFINMVRALLSRHSTLAPALKAWPPLWGLLPSPVKKTHETKAQRDSSAAEDDVKHVDFDMLTAISTSIKLGV